MATACFIRYEIDTFHKDVFIEYARNWGQAIPRCGADLFGYVGPKMALGPTPKSSERPWHPICRVAGSCPAELRARGGFCQIFGGGCRGFFAGIGQPYDFGKHSRILRRHQVDTLFDYVAFNGEGVRAEAVRQ